MPTAIIDLEYDHLPEDVQGLERYSAAQVLVRIGQKPAAWVRVPVEDGQVTREAVLHAVRRQAGHTFWQHLAEHRLGIVTPQPASNVPTATIAICTRERADDLRRCLAGLQMMLDRSQDKTAEVLVVDSASRTADTRLVVESFAGTQYIRLERKGLNVARNAAMRSAGGEIVLFIDDDAVPDAGWLEAHREAFEHPLTMAATGLTLPLELETGAQEQFEAVSSFSRGFVPRTYDHRNMHPLTAGRAGAGVNMALRRTLIDLIGPFDEALDAGTPTHSGGESELMARIIAGGYRIVYTPSALNWHRHRRSVSELRRTIYGYGAGVYAFWTGYTLKEREWAVPLVAGKWFWYDQLPSLLRSAARIPGAPPWPLPWDELRGCVAGPWAYWQSCRQTRRARQQAHEHSQEMKAA
jgi:glycosyltransferase involved in cell wall biosynthesis